MNTKSYHELCNQPNAFSRRELQQTESALNKSGLKQEKLIQEILKSPAIEKPELHRGCPETDYFLVRIPVEDVEIIVEELADLEAEAISPEGNTTSQASHYASLVDRWFNYLQSI